MTRTTHKAFPTANADPRQTRPSVRTPVALAVKIAIKAQYGANQGRSAEPKGNVEGAPVD